MKSNILSSPSEHRSPSNYCDSCVAVAMPMKKGVELYYESSTPLMVVVIGYESRLSYGWIVAL